MIVVGVEFASDQMAYVVLKSENSGLIVNKGADRLSLGETRSPEALRAFQNAVQTLFTESTPDLIAIKTKPEKGGMRAGAPALKMEGIVLANAPCAVRFISGASINKCDARASELHAYHQLAFKAAMVALKQEQQG